MMRKIKPIYTFLASILVFQGLMLYVGAEEVDQSPNLVVLESITPLDTENDLVLEKKIQQAVGDSLGTAAYQIQFGNPSDKNTTQSIDARYLIRIHYRKTKNSYILYAQIYNPQNGYLIDAFELRELFADIEIQLPEIEDENSSHQILLRDFAKRLLLKLKTNPFRRERTESIQSFIENNKDISKLGLKLKPGKPLPSSDAFVVFTEQEVVSGTKSMIKLREVPATIRVVSDTTIRQRGYRYLFELLRDLPGFDETFFQGLYGSIFMQRGLDAPENLRLLVFIDGIPDNNISSGSAYIKHKYSLHNVKRVEVLYGPASSLYGANAFSGIINMITKDGKDIENYLQTGAGSYYYKAYTKRAAPNGYISIGRKIGTDEDALDIIMSGHYIDSKGPLLNRRDTPLASESQNYWWSDSYTASAIDKNYQLNLKSKWKWLEIGGWQSRDFNGQSSFATGAAYSDDYEMAFWNIMTNTAYMKVATDIGDRLNENLILSYRETNVVDGTDADLDKFGEILGKLEITRYKRPDREYLLDNPLTIKWNRKMNTILGVNVIVAHPANYNTRSVTYDNVYMAQGFPFLESPEVLPENKFQSVTRAAYLQHYWKFVDFLSLTLGYRYDTFHITGRDGPRFCGTTERNLPDGKSNPYYLSNAQAHEMGCIINGKRQYYYHSEADKRYVSSNPRVGLVYSSDNKFSSRLLYGEAFRAPTTRELYSVSSSRITNELLEPEKIHSTQWDLLYSPEESLNTELSFFYNYIEDVISLAGTDIHRPNKSSGENLNRFLNAGKAQVYGFETMVETKIYKTWNIYFNYTYQKAILFDVNDPDLLAHDLNKADTSSIDLTSVCRQILNEQSLGLIQDQCGAYHGDMPRVAKNKFNIGGNVLFWNIVLFDIRLNWSDTRPNISTNPQKSVPPYTMVHLTIGSRDWPSRGLDMNFKVYNLFDSRVDDPGFRNAKGDYFPVIHPRPERYLSWELHYRL